jgi:hypothetical protein
MNEPIYGCAGCQTTGGAGGCPVHGQSRVTIIGPANVETPADYYGHWSTAQLALKAVTKERDALVLQVDELRKEARLWQERAERTQEIRFATAKDLGETKRLNGELKAALHKIACAECTVHDENCEVRRFSACTDCACDPRVAGAAIPGYVCPVMSAEEKRICEAEHAAGGVFCKLAAGHGGRHDAGDVSWAELH